MLDWFNHLGRKPDHPMFNVEEADRLLSGLPWDDPARALEEITSWLTTITSASGFNLATRIDVLKFVDETGQPFEPEVNRMHLASATLSEFERARLWGNALEFWKRLEGAYRLCFDELAREPRLQKAHRHQLPLLIVRRLRALAGCARVLRLRYSAVDEHLWQATFDLYRMSEELGCDNQRLAAYPADTTPTTARQELLRALMLDIASPESMLPPETELTARVAARFADACLFKRTPEAGCNWYIDLAQPKAPQHATGIAALQPTARFFGAGIVIVKIQEVVRRLSAEPGAKEQRFGEEYSSQQKLAVLGRLTRYWGEHPPRRRAPRHTIQTEFTAVRGFRNICQVLPRIEFHGWAEFMVNMDPKLKERLGYDPAAQRPTIASDKWQGQDASSQSVSVIVSRASESSLTLGVLCALRSGDAGWSLGIVRSLCRDTAGRLEAGIEFVGRKPYTQWLRRVGGGDLHVDQRASADASVYDYLNAIVSEARAGAGGSLELLVARGDFIAGGVYETMRNEPRLHVNFEELLERGEDFDRIRCSATREPRRCSSGA